MTKSVLFACCLCLIGFTGFSQKKVADVSLPAKPVYAAVDRPGDLYVVFDNAIVIKYDKNGKQLATRQLASVPTLFDPRDGVRVFAYDRKRQATASIAPDLSELEETPLHPEFAVSGWLVCPSKNEYWLLDSTDVSLKKTREKGKAIAYEASFVKGQANVRQVSYLREYQNFLFVLDREKGIHVLNNLGREVKVFEEPNLPYFSFIGEEIYFPTAQGLQLVDLFTTEKRIIQLPHPATFALITDERMILVSNSKIEFLEFQP